MNRWLSRLPSKYSWYWLLWFVGISLVLWSGLWFSYNPSKLDGWQFDDLRGILILSLATSFISTLLGYFSLKRAFIMTLLASLIGIIQSAVQVRSIDGWGDLIGLLSYMMITAAGFSIGLLIELILWFIRKQNR